MSKLLVNYLTRVQESVFEGYLRKAAFTKLHEGLQKILNTKLDSVRIYSMSETIAKQVITYGHPPLVVDESYYLIEEALDELGLSDEELEHILNGETLKIES